MKCFDYSAFPITLRPKSRYPLRKFELLKDSAVAAGFELCEAPKALADDILRAHTFRYFSAVKNLELSEREQREMGFCNGVNLFERGSRIAGAMIENIKAARAEQVAATLGGGAHHAHRDGGRGFCVFNDIAVACLQFLFENPNYRVLVLDCDVHQGDGTASILASERRALTVSFHASKNFPFQKVPSDMDIEFEDGEGDEPYLSEVERVLSELREQHFDHFIFLAGADPYKEDRLGKLKLSREGLAARDQMVLQWARAKSLPTSIVFGGGYCEPIEPTVELNLQTLKLAEEIFA